MKITTMTKPEADQLTGLAIGRLLRIGSRSPKKGDNEEFSKMKEIIMKANSVLKDYHNYQTKKI